VGSPASVGEVLGVREADEWISGPRMGWGQVAKIGGLKPDLAGSNLALLPTAFFNAA
jgi:hypothetical protein